MDSRISIEGVTDNEYSNSRFSVDQEKVCPENEEFTPTRRIPDQKDLSCVWCTGERISGPYITYTKVNDFYSKTLYIEGKYHPSVVGKIKVQGEVVDVKTAAFAPVDSSSFEKAFTQVWDAIEFDLAMALKHAPHPKDVDDYNTAIASKRKILEDRENVDANANKRCRWAHRFPVLKGHHNDIELVGKVKCDGLHMILVQDDDSEGCRYELCQKECCTRTLNDSLFSHIVRNQGTLEKPYCSSCQAIKDSLSQKS